MAEAPTVINRPQRWDTPFGTDMTDQEVDRVLSIEPFCHIDASKFPSSLSLRGIIANDTRIVRFDDGDIIVREGDYGHSAFLILKGSVRVVLDGLPPEVLGRREPHRRGLGASIAQLWSNHKLPEVRNVALYGRKGGDANERGEGEEIRIFLQDVPGVISAHKTAQINKGSWFGELAALGRTPRAASVFAEGRAVMLEVRWQGLREMRQRDDAIRNQIDRLYRQNALKVHLRETPYFSHLGDNVLSAIADATEFETHGTFDWYGSYQKLAQNDAADRLKTEPIIAEEGSYPNGLIMIRSGFARVSRKFGHGARTLSYLGKGQVYGLAELAHNWKANDPVQLQHTVRAVGYVDILRVPTSVIEKYVLPTLPAESIPKLLDYSAERELSAHAAAPATTGAPEVPTDMLEFLVENRFMNGTATMVIDLDRCTRCDDCVRACAAAHDNNPRFIRHGPVHGHHMFANACMHCADPVCMIGCPTGAIHRDPLRGNVVINDRTCIGCATCAGSCPYSNIRMVEIRDIDGWNFVLDDKTHLPILKATKCDLCADQLGGPGCERACPHDALKRVDMKNVPELARWLNR